MINNDLDFTPWRTALARDRRIQVPDFLQPDAAGRLRQCLAHEVSWTLAERIDNASATIEAGAYAALDEAGRDARLRMAYGRAAQGFQYAYESYPMVEATKEGRDPGLLLHTVLQFLNSPPFLGFARWLADDAGIDLVTAQATRYSPGHFLTEHDDQEVTEGRAYAYVINLTPRWRTDWGGLLHFVAPDGQVERTFLPRYNSLALFRVPQPHCVSLVSPWAGEPRLSITGWWLRRSA